LAPNSSRIRLTGLAPGLRGLTWSYAALAVIGLVALVVGIALGALGAILWGSLMLAVFVPLGNHLDAGP